MSQSRRLRKNLIYNACYQVLTIIVPLLTAPYISRVLGVDGVGEYGYTYSIAHYFVLVTMLGVLNYGNREISQIRGDSDALADTFWNIYSIQFLWGLVTVGTYFLYVFILCPKHQLVMICQGLYVIAGLLDISWFYFGIEKFQFTAVISALNKIVTTVLVFLLVKHRDDTYIYACIIAGGALLNNAVYWFFLKHNIHYVKPNIHSARRHIKPLVILFIPVIAVSIYKYMDKIMLGAMCNTTEVGIYESAEKFINLPMCFIAAIGTVMLPRITNMKANHETKGVLQYNFLSMVTVMFLSIGMSFGLAGIAHLFIPWFYGADFAQSVNVLLVLLPTIVFVSWANVIRTQCLLPEKRDFEYCLSVISGAIINLLINMMMIPTKGATGAAIGTLVAEGTVCIIQSVMCAGKMPFMKYMKYSAPLVFCAIVMQICINHINLSSVVFTVCARIVAGGGIYTVLSAGFMRKAYLACQK